MMWNNIGLKLQQVYALVEDSLRMMWNNIGLKLVDNNLNMTFVWEWCEII